MIITSSILFYQLAKNCELVEKKAPSNKLQINSVKFYNGKTEVGNLYLVDCRKLEKPIVSKKPVSLIYINAEKLDKHSIPSNCDYAIFKNIRNYFDLSEIVYDAINELQNWDCKLKDAINNRLPLDEFGALAKEIINEPLFVLTHNLSLLSLSGDKPYEFLTDDIVNERADESIYKSNFGQVLNIKYVRRLLSDREYEKSNTYSDTYIYNNYSDMELLCLNIFSDGRYIAKLVAPATFYNGNLDEGLVQLFRHYYTYFKQIYLRYSDDPLIKTSSDKLHQLINDLLFSPQSVDEMDANLILQNYCWSINNRYSIIKFSFFKNAKWNEMTAYICGKLEETWSNSCAITHDEDIIWVFNHSLSKDASDEHKFFHVLAYIVRDFVCKAGVSDTFRDINKVSQYLKQANAALVTGQKNNPNKWYFKFQDYALDYMYDQIVSDLSIDQIIYDGIKKLIEYDKKNNTEYLATLRSYIYNNCNSTHTADELFIHRTTLIRRIERIQEICDIDFNNKINYLYMQVSIWILEKINFEFNNPNAIKDE